MGKRGMNPTQARKLRLKKGLEETKLQRYRVKKGLSQAELADVSGVTKRSIQVYEQGKSPVDSAKFETICDLAESLDCKIEDILEDETLLEKYKRVK